MSNWAEIFYGNSGEYNLDLMSNHDFDAFFWKKSYLWKEDGCGHHSGTKRSGVQDPTKNQNFWAWTTPPPLIVLEYFVNDHNFSFQKPYIRAVWFKTCVTHHIPIGLDCQPLKRKGNEAVCQRTGDCGDDNLLTIEL